MARRILSIALFVVFTQLALACHKHRQTCDDKWARRHHVPYQNGIDSCSCYGGGAPVYGGTPVYNGGGAVIASPPVVVPNETLPSPKKMPPSTVMPYNPPQSLNATPVYNTPIYNGR